MGLVGRLEDLNLPDILRLISMSKRTGKLNLSRREGNGIIVCRGGKIIYAASDSVRDTLGNILVSQKLLTEADLLAALEAQHESSDAKRLGTILMEMGFLSREKLDEVIRGQFEKVIGEFLAWKTGFFRFELIEVPESEEVEVDAKDFLLEGGLSSDAVILEAARKLDEMARDAARQVPPPAPPPDPLPAPSPAEVWSSETTVTLPQPASPQFQPLAALKSALAEIRSPSFTGEITLLLLRYAEQIVNRGVLFGLRKDGITGMGQRGVQLPGASADERVRATKIPLDEPSVFFEVIETKQPYRGPLEKNRWNDYLVEQLGGQVPAEVIVIPMTVNGSAVITFYGDNLPNNAPIRPTDDLELLMTQVGLDMERTLLETRMKSFEKKRGKS